MCEDGFGLTSKNENQECVSNGFDTILWSIGFGLSGSIVLLILLTYCWKTHQKKMILDSEDIIFGIGQATIEQDMTYDRNSSDGGPGSRNPGTNKSIPIAEISTSKILSDAEVSHDEAHQEESTL